MIIQSKTLIRWTLGALILWNGLIILAPILGQSSWRPLQLLSGGIYFFMDPVCHQLPQRSLFLQHLPFPVCARCFSIYLAGLFVFAAGAAQKTVRSWPYRRYVILGLVAALGIVLEKVGLLPDLNEVRFINGLIGGFFLFRLLLESFLPGEAGNSVTIRAKNIMEEN